MKRLTILILALLSLSSCAVFVPQQRSVTAAVLDYRPYTLEGFFLSPDPYMAEHDALGELFIEVLPQQKEVRYNSDGQIKDNLEQITVEFDGSYGFERIDFDELLSIAVNKAKEMGADGICNLKISKNSTARHIRYEVTGLCIKRK